MLAADPDHGLLCVVNTQAGHSPLCHWRVTAGVVAIVVTATVCVGARAIPTGRSTLGSDKRGVPIGWNAHAIYFSVKDAGGVGSVQVSFALPALWLTKKSKAEGGYFYNTATSSYLTARSYSTPGSRAHFFSVLRGYVPKLWRQTDPHAQVHLSVVAVPGDGSVLVTSAEMTLHNGSHAFRERLQEYWFWVRGFAFTFRFTVPPAKDTIDIPVFDAAAQTIRVSP